MSRDQHLRAAVLTSIDKEWSPEQVAGRLEHENDRRVISHETIYRFIYPELIRTRVDG